MSRIGRNQPCPCGSGKKFKKCHGASGQTLELPIPLQTLRLPIPPEKVLKVLVDEGRKQLQYFSRDMLSNSLRRDCPKIEESFDNLCAAEFAAMDELFSNILVVITAGLQDEEKHYKPNVQSLFVFLMMNATTSFLAAMDLTRRGFRLQPGIIIRNIIETLTTVCHLGQNYDDLEKFQKGELSSTKTLASSKKVIPWFGHMYGLFSEKFAHISNLHQIVNPLIPYRERGEDALDSNICFLRLSLWMIYVVAEAAFYPSISEHRYWENPKGVTYTYAPSNKELDWARGFLGIPELR